VRFLNQNSNIIGIDSGLNSIPFIDNGRTRRPLTPIKYMDKTVSTTDSDNKKEYIQKKIEN